MLEISNSKFKKLDLDLRLIQWVKVKFKYAIVPLDGKNIKKIYISYLDFFSSL